MSTVLNLQNVSVIRGGRKILNDVSWTVNEGERWVVLGPNGAGKSTLLSIAAARLHPTSGEVEILDETLGAVDVFDLRPRIGLSSGASATQIPANEKVSDVVVTAAYAVSGRWKEEYDVMDDDRATELLAEWGVDTLADRTFGSLSDGERKRALIARALMTDPEMLLLDEPGSGMDISGREDLVERLTVLAADPTHRLPCSSPITSRKSRRASPTPCWSVTVAWSLPARSCPPLPRRTSQQPTIWTWL